MQAWPLFRKPTPSTWGITASRSASSRMIDGPLPPSSSVTRFSVSAAVRMIVRPVAVEPVKVTLRTSGWAVSAAPATAP
jgi:hypothetical protein